MTLSIENIEKARAMLDKPLKPCTRYVSFGSISFKINPDGTTERLDHDTIANPKDGATQ